MKVFWPVDEVMLARGRPVAEIELALNRLIWPVAEGRYVGKAEH